MGRFSNNKLVNILLYLIIIIGILLIISSLLSLIYDVSLWYSKIFDFPRTQYLIGCIVCLFLFFIFYRKSWRLWETVFVVGLFAAIIIHSSRILPYYVGKKTVADATKEQIDDEKSIGVFIANVLMENRETEKLFDILEKTDPDLILLMEVDKWWINQLDFLEKDFPYTMEYPADNAYGMALYSKFPLTEKKIEFFQHEKVPSFHAAVNLPSEKKFRFHGMHPVPPFPSKKFPDNVGKEEVALIQTADLIAQDSLASIVAGDFNDVSWSNTSRLFESSGNLKNVRIGRGLFNSFNAHSVFIRWPLDHFFVTEEFALVELKKLPKFGSDHFPMYAKFVLTSSND